MADYHLDSLGWYQFERLCQALFKVTLGMGVEAWGGSGDFGRDAYFDYSLHYPDNAAPLDGPFLFQAKFVSEASARGSKPIPELKKAVNAEVKRIEERVEAGEWVEPNCYTLITNCPLSGSDKKDVRELLEKVLPDTTVIVVDGATDLYGMLDGAPQVRLAYPQILGIRDLKELIASVVDREIKNRANITIARAQDLAPVFVPTSAYSQSLGAIEEHGFVVLSGPPEMGKTSIAQTIALAKYLDGWTVIEVLEPRDVISEFNPEERQIFVADDAFGTTEYSPELTFKWEKDLEGIIGLLDSDHQLILTSRPAPLRSALDKLSRKGVASSFPDPGEVLVQANALTAQEKAQMLYRHAKAALDSPEERDLVKQVAGDVVGHNHFTPLRIQRFVTEQLPQIAGSDEDKREELLRESVRSSLMEPSRGMQLSYAALDPPSRALLTSMLEQGRSSMLISLVEPAYERHCDESDSTPIESAAHQIDEHFVKVSQLVGNSYIAWVHPSGRDLVIDELMKDGAARSRFLNRCGVSGAVLALSVGGGIAGEREYPFLQTEGDWSDLTARLEVLLKDGSPEDIARLLQLGHETMGNSTSTDTPEQADRLAAVSLALAESVRSEMDQRELVWTNSELEWFYELSKGDVPPLAGADLRATWDERNRALNEVLGYEYPDPGLLVDRATEMEDFLTLVSSQDPRWLDALNTDNYMATARQRVVDAIVQHVRLAGDPDIESDDPDDYEDPGPETDWVGQAESLLAAAGYLGGALNDRVSTLRDELAEFEAAWIEYDEKHRRFHYEPDYDRHSGHGSGADEVFDLGRFFSDL